ncbi:hypothetical protein NLX86_29675 [Streptomyces sp. A3M-1-3]|uniref:hypothetical protein n=1 Tax=Streptomyces sp. A3M-1-3 TaxID=2962044 RepID=UPI0020B8E7DE|nr:hypothetical protein [Streptomyces sp. A3M-1-3]MCP3822108.1 hypothetical protein [Streptomyces sp. A3M-1-3]
MLTPDAAASPIAPSHLAVEEALRAASPAVEVTILRPRAFAGNAQQWSWSVRATGAVNLPYPGSHCDAIHETDLAEAALAVLTAPAGAAVRGRRHLLTGPESITFAEQIAILEGVTGRPITVHTVSPQDWKAEVAGYVPEHFADALLNYWRASDGSPVPLTRTAEDLTGHPGRTFATWAEENAAAFRDWKSVGPALRPVACWRRERSGDPPHLRP